mgnify:CR=1 FL=1
MIDAQRRDQDHVHVLGEEEERERHARVLDVEAGDDLDSPSATSNGWRLVSAMPDTR